VPGQLPNKEANIAFDPRGLLNDLYNVGKLVIDDLVAFLQKPGDSVKGILPRQCDAEVKARHPIEIQIEPLVDHLKIAVEKTG